MPIERLELPCRLSQQDFNDFARLSGDHNPIHVDPAFAARTPFGATVSHGMLLYSRLQGALLRAMPGAVVAAQQLMFPAPSYADEDLTLILERSSGDGDGDGDGEAKRVLMQVRKADGRLGLDGEAWLETPRAARLSDRSAAGDVPATALPRFQSLARGQTVIQERVFNVADLATWAGLAGLSRAPETVPGPLIGALFSYLLGERLPGHGTNYLKQSLDFHDTARPDEPLRAAVTISRLRGDKALVDLDTSCHGADGRTLCSGRALVRFHH
ncbi:MAG: MaoC/PaaZ C-terminal domain-containing protein [Pigmentiphaga sp.]